MEDWQSGGFGLYLHWPFCQSKCPYCDFNSHVAGKTDQKRWQSAYLAEIDRLAKDTAGRVLQTVFFGGGTPSLMEPDLVSAIINRIRSSWPMSNNPEITLEANPGSIEMGRFRGYRDAGVTRVSMGMQAMNDADLRLLGRVHSAEEARKAFEVARQCFERVSFDLIYARQKQCLSEWRSELNSALDLAVDHLSLYQLTIEDGTVFGERHARGGLKGLPGEDLAADMYELTQEICSSRGLPAYEVSNHARPGAESLHNLIYWRGGDYVGIGPGAHGRLTLGGTRFATEAPKSPDLWLALVESGAAGELPRTSLALCERADEYLIMSLRLREGMEVDRYEAMAGRPLDITKVANLSSLGLILNSGNRIAATDKGRVLLNAIIRELAVN
ncbi:MAG: radical SAM family heme chaperone HemW [Cypionkella sp.]